MLPTWKKNYEMVLVIVILNYCTLAVNILKNNSDPTSFSVKEKVGFLPKT